MDFKNFYIPMGKDTPKYFGPFLRANKNDKWHWIRDCPSFPKMSSPEIRFTTSAPESEELCISCSQIESRQVAKAAS